MSKDKNNAGFSLIELMIGMTLLLIMMGGAVTLLGRSFQTRFRENQKSDAVADAQRALNIMSREIANSGYGLSDHGIVVADSGNTSIHFRANLTNTNSTTSDPDEDLTYSYQAANSALVRYDANTGQTASLASSISNVQISFLDTSGNTIAPFNSTTDKNVAAVQITVTVNLPQRPGIPASSVALQSNVALRNAVSMLAK